MMAVNLSISVEQAALLVPLLEQISSKSASAGDNPLQSTGSSVSSNSSPTSPIAPETPRDSSCQKVFTADEMLTKRKKNTMCNSAQAYLLVRM